MTNFGNKFNSSIKRLGVKMERGTRQLGHKITGEMGRNQSVFRKIDNTLQVAKKMRHLSQVLKLFQLLPLVHM